MKYRPQLGGLNESMQRVVELDPTIAALSVHLGVPADSITIKPYVFDARIGWDTYLVSVDGSGVGFTDGPAN